MKYFIYNENSILITFDSNINSELVYKISSLRIKIEHDFNEYLIDAVQSINSLLIIFKRNKISANDLLNKIKNVNPENTPQKVKSKIWEIPVCYDLTFATDLEEFSKSKKISKNEVVQLHKSKIYDVISMGFLPGFMYLGTTDYKLHCERKLKPSLEVKRGSIGVALNQTCIYPQDSPGGWHIIGVSPLEFFNLKSKSPCFVNPGDKIKFLEISKSAFETLKKNKSFKPNFS